MCSRLVSASSFVGGGHICTKHFFREKGEGFEKKFFLLPYMLPHSFNLHRRKTYYTIEL